MKVQDKFILDLASKGKRIDGRRLDEFRKMQLDAAPFSQGFTGRTALRALNTSTTNLSAKL